MGIWVSALLTSQGFMAAMQQHANAGDAAHLQRFFKTGKGQYGEGDMFIGVCVPVTRRLCKQFRGMPLAEVEKLLESPVHEHRLAAVIMMCDLYRQADEFGRNEIYTRYLEHARRGRINNWDIIDVSAEHVVGLHLLERSRQVLFELARSQSVWERRLAIISTFAFIKRGDAATTIDIARLLLHDNHDLIRKAVGWMLREVGKRVGRSLLLTFLGMHAHEMPRTMLRYAIEHLSPELRLAFMSRKV